MVRLFFLAVLLVAGGKCFSGIYLPAILSNNMVLQQNCRVAIWGWSTSYSETISVWGSWGSDTVKVETDLGRWKVFIQTPAKDGPYTVYVKGHVLATITNVLIGEVWLCSGQSNMEMPVDSISRDFPGVVNYKSELQKARFPAIRLFQVEKAVAGFPQDDCRGRWLECTPENVDSFSAVGYYFGKELHSRLNTPIGLINSSWGGTNIETWMPAGVIEQDTAFGNAVKQVQLRKWWPSLPGLAYNAMIHPIQSFAIAGVIWYQGESNKFNGVLYKRLFPAMIHTWRHLWQKEFPFYYVQIAPYRYEAPPASLVREAQLETMGRVPGTGMAVTNDIGDLTFIHPTNKQDVGRRLALWALAKTYGVPGIVYSGPLYRQMEVSRNKIKVYFDHAGEGLVLKKEEGFEIAGSDQRYVKAKVTVEKDHLLVWSEEVPVPVAVRFAFHDTDQPGLYNKAGLPASAFRTDNWNHNLE